METYYSILEVNSTATESEIKRSYLKLAQKYHPDRYTDPEEKKKANDQFSRITEAHRILSDEKLRQAYDQALAKGVSRQPKDEARETQARNAFSRALQFLKQNDPWRAVNLLRITCRYDTQPIYLSYLGLALVYTRQYKNEGMDKLSEAAKQLMFNPVVHVNIGLAHEFLGNKNEALRAFHEALNWDGKNQTALKGIERIQPSKGGNIFTKFFGKK
jgi:curved DNA-binding protein CbpA